ncbi:S8 family peptidase [Pseudoxanthomonas dokdonensis]|uniref:Protease n=1 Tax=Pseudoxanthomonas dokdonensis TaxID=344882 RepID=A0A0R0CVG7_9GAMM|nr:S8 family peptidase [Pseudoxanthomonas dokdonensis]KRG69652.1 hypothetical protein ABB29_09290 [Pseudoxanthomonas dokdonensis]
MATAIATGIAFVATGAMAAEPLKVMPLQHSQQADSYNKFIVKYRDGKATPLATVQRSLRTAAANSGLRADLNGKTAIQLDRVRTMGTGAQVIHSSRKLDKVEADALLRQLQQDPNVLYAEISRVKTIAAVPNDTYYDEYQWHYDDPAGGINAPAAWDHSTGEGVVVAVLDTGITPHSDLDANMLPGYDFITEPVTSRDGDGRDDNPLDEGDWVAANECPYPNRARNSSWHGTHVTGTVAAVTNNAKGMAGVAYNAKVVPIRVLGRCGGDTDDIADAVIWAAGGEIDGIPVNPNPAEVINLSLGGPGACSESEKEAFAYARSQGATVVIAAGNDELDVSDFSPANCPGVITVAASRKNGGAAFYTNYGDGIDIAAPGGEGNDDGVPNGFVWSTGNAGTTVPTEEAYFGGAGTSQAAPHVAGVVAMMQSVAETPLTPDEVLATLQATLREFPVAIDSSRPIGPGLVDAAAAVNAVLNGDGGGEGGDGTPLQNNVAVPDQQGGTLNFKIEVPAGAKDLLLITYGGSGNVSLYVNRNAPATADDHDQRSARPGNNEAVRIRAPLPGTYYLSLVGADSFRGVSVRASYK